MALQSLALFSASLLLVPLKSDYTDSEDAEPEEETIMLEPLPEPREPPQITLVPQFSQPAPPRFELPNANLADIARAQILTRRAAEKHAALQSHLVQKGQQKLPPTIMEVSEEVSDSGSGRIPWTPAFLPAPSGAGPSSMLPPPAPIEEDEIMWSPNAFPPGYQQPAIDDNTIVI